MKDALRAGAFRLRSIGPRKFALLGLRRVWSSTISFGLSADLEELPAARPARIAVRMEPTDTASFTGFDDEVERASGGGSVEVADRQELCAAGVATLYVAVDDSNMPIYAQWLIRRHEQEALHRKAHGLFPQLEETQALLEGAYTFMNFRRLGVMADGMRQLLLEARDAGDRRVFTYVAEGNVPSLRGCANVGFVLDHVRQDRRRLGVRRVRRLPPDAAAKARWAAALG